jgi:hypothetical protein
LPLHEKYVNDSGTEKDKRKEIRNAQNLHGSSQCVVTSLTIAFVFYNGKGIRRSRAARV